MSTFLNLEIIMKEEVNIKENCSSYGAHFDVKEALIDLINNDFANGELIKVELNTLAKEGIKTINKRLRERLTSINESTALDFYNFVKKTLSLENQSRHLTDLAIYIKYELGALPVELERLVEQFNLIRDIRETYNINLEIKKEVLEKTNILTGNEWEKIELNTEFASESLTEIPLNRWIDKSIGGCGMSYLALKDNHNAVILAPRVALIENKMAQIDKYPDLLPVLAGVTKKDVLSYMERRKEANRPIKIYATYHSLSLGKLDYLLESTDCRIYVDESQYLLEFAEKEPSLCIDLHNRLEKNIKRVSFFSAHPPKSEYMPRYIKYMRKIKYTWSNQTKVMPYTVDTNKPYWTVAFILNELLVKGEYCADYDFTFKKAIVFVNSISGIVSIIERLGASKSNFGYIVGDTVENSLKLDNLANKITDYANLPLITFGTSSMISGIDLEDNETANIVISSTSKSWTMFDQELDVPQAITRQRLKSNPFNDKFIFILNKKDMEAKIKGLEKKYIETVELLKDVVSGANCLKDNNENVNLAYETYKGYYMLESDSYVVNESLLLAKKYAFKELFAQYDTGYDVRGKFSKGKSIKVDSFKAPTFADYSKKIQNAETVSEKLSIIETIHNENWKTWLRYGVGKGKVLINNKEAKAFFESRNDYKGVILAIHKAFKPNTRYTIKEVRIKLSEIYKVKGLDKKIKASDLNEFFEVQYKKAKVEGKVIRVVQIIRPF